MNEGSGEVLKRLKLKAKYTTKELCFKGEKIYVEIKETLEPTLNSKFVAIEVDSGDYFIGNDAIETTERAKKRYPDSTFFLVRIGHSAAFKTNRGIKVLQV
ncbi:hypothetical protein DRN76_04870 [Methanosarcinales archaeon]|nr:MAG: hypothetical protein DRN76_04870 [Methanosarcinales archaeon]